MAWTVRPATIAFAGSVGIGADRFLAWQWHTGPFEFGMLALISLASLAFVLVTEWPAQADKLIERARGRWASWTFAVLALAVVSRLSPQLDNAVWMCWPIVALTAPAAVIRLLERRGLVAVVGFAFAVRLLGFYADHDYLTRMSGAGFVIPGMYLDRAHDLLHGTYQSTAYTPGYPAFLATCLACHVDPRWMQALLDSLAVLLLERLLRVVGIRPMLALLGCAAYAWAPTFSRGCLEIMAEALSPMLVMAILVTLISRRWCVAGLVTGFAVLVRPDLAIAAPLGIAWAWSVPCNE